MSLPNLTKCPALSDAIESFIRSNTSFPSNTAITEAATEMERMTDVNEIFKVPLSHKLFSMEGALLWAFFLDHALRAAAEKETPFSSAKAFSIKSAFQVISAVYDLGVEELIHDSFGDDEEGSDE